MARLDIGLPLIPRPIHPQTLLQHIAARWDIAVLLADTKELPGLDQYQLMRAKAIRRFWTLVMVAYCFLAGERLRLQHHDQRHRAIGDAWCHTRCLHWSHFIVWLQQRFVYDHFSPAQLHVLLLP